MRIVYCDTLSIRAVTSLLRVRFRLRSRLVVYILDPLPSWVKRMMFPWLLRRLGVTIQEAAFFAGHLRTADGEGVYCAARRLAMPIALTIGGQLVQESPLLSRLDASHKPYTIRCLLARAVWFQINEALLRAYVSQALARQMSINHPLYMLRAPHLFELEDLREAMPDMEVLAYGSIPTWLIKLRNLPILLLAAYGRVVRLTLTNIHNFSAEPKTPVRPGVLTVQHDELGTDRSYRMQPHWVPGTGSARSFEIYVLAKGRKVSPETRGALARVGVTLLDNVAQAALQRRIAGNPFDCHLRREIWFCLKTAAITKSSRQFFATMHVLSLLVRSLVLGRLCLRLGIRTFITGENYLLEADSMQFAGAALGIHTVSYQYSNLPFVSAAMVCTADVMLISSRLYEQVLSFGSVRPGVFKEIGYVYDSAFSLVKDRAVAARQRLAQAGATYVIAYFDESVQYDRYGLVASTDHRAEILELASQLLADPTMGVVVKTQFVRNSPSRLYAGERLINEALATGRYIELVAGRHRNVVFPCEAALVSDIVINHAFGATAALESALAGRRTVLIDAYGHRGLADYLYKSGDIVYPSLTAALEAIKEFRLGKPARRGLGDWSSIIAAFDAHRDGQAADRLCTILESLVFDGAKSAKALKMGVA